MIFDKNFMSLFFLRITTWWLAMFYEVHLRITSVVINMKLSFFSFYDAVFSVKGQDRRFSPSKTYHYRFFFDIFLIIRKSSVNILEAKKKQPKFISHIESHIDVLSFHFHQQWDNGTIYSFFFVGSSYVVDRI